MVLIVKKLNELCTCPCIVSIIFQYCGFVIKPTSTRLYPAVGMYVLRFPFFCFECHRQYCNINRQRNNGSLLTLFVLFMIDMLLGVCYSKHVVFCFDHAFVCLCLCWYLLYALPMVCHRYCSGRTIYASFFRFVSNCVFEHVRSAQSFFHNVLLFHVLSAELE